MHVSPLSVPGTEPGLGPVPLDLRLSVAGSDQAPGTPDGAGIERLLPHDDGMMVRKARLDHQFSIVTHKLPFLSKRGLEERVLSFQRVGKPEHTVSARLPRSGAQQSH